MKKKKMAALSLLIKPASGLCNLKCDYCFYREEVTRLQDFHQKVMSDEMMELLIQRVFESAGKYVQFSFQGGEPTVAGLDYFLKFTELAEKSRNRQTVSYAFQTNGILLDKDWAALFRKHRFLVGLSFDGTDQLHDRYRLGSGGEKTAARVKTAWELLCEEKIDTNILCVVTGPMARNPEKVYRYLRRMGAGFWQFIPCMGGDALHLNSVVGMHDPYAQRKDTLPAGEDISHLGDAPERTHRISDWALAPKDYAYFLKGMFDLWYRDWRSGQYISIRNFDDYIHLLCGQGASTCAACGECGGYLVVENDGSVYPCDFYVEDSWCLGNIRESSFDELRYGDKMREFLDETRTFHQNGRCQVCEYYSICRGGCKHDNIRLSGTEKGAGDSENINIFCEAYQEFFRYAMPRMLEIAQAESRCMSYF